MPDDIPREGRRTAAAAGDGAADGPPDAGRQGGHGRRGHPGLRVQRFGHDVDGRLEFLHGSREQARRR